MLSDVTALFPWHHYLLLHLLNFPLFMSCGLIQNKRISVDKWLHLRYCSLYILRALGRDLIEALIASGLDSFDKEFCSSVDFMN